MILALAHAWPGRAHMGALPYAAAFARTLVNGDRQGGELDGNVHG